MLLKRRSLMEALENRSMMAADLAVDGAQDANAGEGFETFALFSITEDGGSELEWLSRNSVAESKVTEIEFATASIDDLESSDVANLELSHADTADPTVGKDFAVFDWTDLSSHVDSSEFLMRSGSVTTNATNDLELNPLEIASLDAFEAMPLVDGLAVVTAIEDGNSVFETVDFDNGVSTWVWHNATLPVDVDGNSSVTSEDALLLIEALNSFGAGATVSFELSGAIQANGSSALHLDINGDNYITPLDALLVVNFIKSGNDQNDQSAFAFVVRSSPLVPSSGDAINDEAQLVVSSDLTLQESSEFDSSDLSASGYAVDSAPAYFGDNLNALSPTNEESVDLAFADESLSVDWFAVELSAL